MELFCFSGSYCRFTPWCETLAVPGAISNPFGAFGWDYLFKFTLLSFQRRGGTGCHVLSTAHLKH